METGRSRRHPEKRRSTPQAQISTTVLLYDASPGSQDPSQGFSYTVHGRVSVALRSKAKGPSRGCKLGCAHLRAPPQLELNVSRQSD